MNVRVQLWRMQLWRNSWRAHLPRPPLPRPPCRGHPCAWEAAPSFVSCGSYALNVRLGGHVCLTDVAHQNNCSPKQNVIGSAEWVMCCARTTYTHRQRDIQCQHSVRKKLSFQPLSNLQLEVIRNVRPREVPNSRVQHSPQLSFGMRGRKFPVLNLAK